MAPLWLCDPQTPSSSHAAFPSMPIVLVRAGPAHGSRSRLFQDLEELFLYCSSSWQKRDGTATG